jgi:autotransporter-associated beta strand protein
VVLSNSNTYDRATVITEGTLAITGPTQATNSIAFTGGSLGLDTGFPVTASSAAVNLANGTIKVTGSTGADSYILLTAASIEGTPVLAETVSGYELQIVDGATDELRLVKTGATSPYDTWSANQPFDSDLNNDGVSNGLAFLLGASGPNVNALDKLPTVTQTGGDLKLTFDMLPSAARGGAQLFVEHSADLGTWATGVLVPDASGGTAPVTFIVNDSNLDNPLNPLDVEVTISSDAADGGKLFGRLKAVNP